MLGAWLVDDDVEALVLLSLCWSSMLSISSSSTRSPKGSWCLAGFVVVLVTVAALPDGSQRMTCSTGVSLLRDVADVAGLRLNRRVNTSVRPMVKPAPSGEGGCGFWGWSA